MIHSISFFLKMTTSTGPCANPNCILGGIASSTHQCPDCGKNVHAPCGKETDDLHLVLCPPCEIKRETAANMIVSPPPPAVVQQEHAIALDSSISTLPPSMPTIATNEQEVGHDSSTCLQQMLQHVDNGVHALRTEWKGSIIFPIAPVLSSVCTQLSTFRVPPVKEDDICLYLGGQRTDYSHLYFCPVTFVPPLAGSNTHTHFNELKRLLEKAAIDCASPIFCNGGSASSRSGGY